jgi:HlyD family secretion protein
MKRTVLALLGLVLLIASLTAANLRRDPGAIDLDWRIVKPPAREVTVESPKRGLIIQTVTAPGAVEPVEEAEIASQIVGRVVEVHVKDGDSVKEGSLLVKLDDTDAKARLDSAIAGIDRLKAAIKQAEQECEKTARDFERASVLAGRRVGSQTEQQDARTAQLKAEAALTMSRNELAESEAMRRMSLQEFTRTEIRAPINGVVAGLEVEVGEVVIAGTTNLPGTVLMTVGDLSHMQIRADVDETDVPLVERGQPVNIYLQSNLTKPIPGFVDRVAPKGKKSEEVVSFETLIRVEGQDASLRSGMTATVEIEVQHAPDVLGVPVQAVVHRRRKDLPDTRAVRDWSSRHARTPGEKAKDLESLYVKIVFVAENGQARARPVETGISDERRVEILSGLKPTDRVVVGPFRALDELKDGDPVTPAKPESEESAP